MIALLVVANMVAQFLALYLFSNSHRLPCGMLSTWVIVFGLTGLATYLVQTIDQCIKNHNIRLLGLLLSAFVFLWTIYGSVLAVRPDFTSFYSTCMASKSGSQLVYFVYYYTICSWSLFAFAFVLVFSMAIVDFEALIQ